MTIDRSSDTFSDEVFAQMTQYPDGEIPKELALEVLQVIGQRAQEEGLDLASCFFILNGTFADFPYEITVEDLAAIGISVPYRVK